MVKGSLQCLGPSQHLKTKFGQGYETQIHCSTGATDDVISNFTNLFIGTDLQERHGDFIALRTTGALNLAQAFGWLEEAKQNGSIVDYSVTQTSLEQIFVSFAGGNNIHAIDELEISARL
jgi:hypothetical protein